MIGVLALFLACEDSLPGGAGLQRPVVVVTESAANQEPEAPIGQRGSCRPTRYWQQQPQAEQTVMIKGELNSPSNLSVLIDVISVEEQRVVFGVECVRSRAFSFETPFFSSDLWLYGFVDEDGNGPSTNDVQGRSARFTLVRNGAENLRLNLSNDIVDEAFRLQLSASSKELVVPAVQQEQ